VTSSCKHLHIHLVEIQPEHVCSIYLSVCWIAEDETIVLP